MDPLFEKLNSVATMLEAERELISSGEAAVKRLEALFDGSSRNNWDVPYRKLGLPLQCALEVVVRLGPIAKPLEPYIVAELPNSEVAARALGALNSLAPSSVYALAMTLNADQLVASEAALTLVKHGQDRDPSVNRVASRSAAAQRHLETARQRWAEADMPG
ncbi:MAG: hypothetical protein ACRECW_04475 [Phyllobacterium sp.]